MRHETGSFGGCRLKVSRFGVGCCFVGLVLASYIFSFDVKHDCFSLFYRCAFLKRYFLLMFVSLLF